MTFTYSREWNCAIDLQGVLNAGLFYTLSNKKTGEPVSHHFTLEDARRAKTRKTRVVLTRNLLNQAKVNEIG